MTKIKPHITFFLMLICGFIYSQQFTNYTTKDGLPSNHIYTILQDAKGFMWFLTDKGMVKFNGNQFKTFTTKEGLPVNDVWEAITTPDAKTWYLSKSSSLGYIENDSVYSFSTSNENEIMNPIFSSQIGNKVYLAGPNKTFELQKGKWENIYTNNLNAENINKIFHENVKYYTVNLNKESIKIFGTNNLIIKEYNTKNILKKTSKRKQLNDSLYCIVTDKEYLFLNLNSLKLTVTSFKDEIGLENVKHARINVINNKIQITGAGFVGFIDTNFHIKDPYFFPKDINSHFAIIDKSKNIWFATFSNGIYKLPYVKQQLSYQLTNNKTGKFSVISNQLYTSVFNKGYYKFNDSTDNFNLFLKDEDYPFKPIEFKQLNTSFFPSKFKISIKKANTLITIDFRKDGIFTTNPLGFNFIYFKNHLYGITNLGLNRINETTLEIEKNFLQNSCTYLYEFKNKLLIATNNGLIALKNDTLHKVKFANKTFNKSILTIYKISENSILLNTDGFGSYITDLNTITPLPGSEFLIAENAFIEENTLWLATNQGVLKYIKENNNYLLKETINANSGLPSNNINDVIIHKNKIFVSTNNGVAILPKNQPILSQFLDIYIEKATYNDLDLTHNSSFGFTENNTINFYISSIDFSEDNAKLNYNYRLLPIQKEWIKTSSNNLNFNKLSPKKYTLEINSNNITKTYHFRITPLWWQRTISKIIFSLLGVSVLAVLLLKIRNRELTKKTEQLNTQKQLAEFELHALRSQMNPHFIFNSLNSIQYFITKNDAELSEKYLVKFSRLIRKFFDFSRDKFISLDQEISMLNDYLEIEKMRFGNEFNYEFTIDKTLNLSEQKIPSMLLQPIVENAVIHGLFHNEGNGLITINFKRETNTNYAVEILDNGVGLEKAKEIKQNSLKTHISKSSEILKDRIKLLNKSKIWHITYSIKEIENSKGTIVKLTFLNYE